MSKGLKMVGTVGKTAAVTAGVAGLGYVAGATYVAKKTQNAVDNCAAGVADDLTHLMAHHMSSGSLEEQLTLRRHEGCGTKTHRRFINNNFDKSNGCDGPEF